MAAEDLTLQIVDNDHSLPRWSQLVVLVFSVGKSRRFTENDVKSRLPAIPSVDEALIPLLETHFIEAISNPGGGEHFQLVKSFSNPRSEQLRVRVGVVFMSDGNLYDEDAFRAGIGYQDGRKVVSEMRKAGYPIEEERGDRSILSYRLTSSQPTGSVKHVTGIPASQKRQLFSRDHYTCVFCGKQFEEKELFPDHKLPANIAGDHVDFGDDSWMRDFQTVVGHVTTTSEKPASVVPTPLTLLCARSASGSIQSARKVCC